METPTTQLTYRTSKQIYAGRANRIAIKHHLGRTVAIIEIRISGNKDSRAAMNDFVEKTIDFLRRGIHVSDGRFVSTVAEGPRWAFTR